MKRSIALIMLAGCLLLTACSAVSIGRIGASDGPTAIYVSEKEENIKKIDIDKYFKDNYVNERRLPVLDIHIDNPFVSDDRTLILDDSIENSLELMVYEYYRNRMSGNYSEVKNSVTENLRITTENEEKQFKEGLYCNKVILDEIDVLDKDDLDEISYKNKQNIVKLLSELNMTEFAIVEVDKTVKLNQKYLSVGPQIGDGEVTRYYLLGKSGDTYKIAEVFWEGLIFIDD